MTFEAKDCGGDFGGCGGGCSCVDAFYEWKVIGREGIFNAEADVQPHTHTCQQESESFLSAGG